MTSPASGGFREGKLALTLQEAFTAAVRLRSERQVADDADAFRAHMKQQLQTAHETARQAGYDSETVKLAMYAFVAFLDESVLNSRQQMFEDWPRKPLQEEVFGDHMGGETFFHNVRDLLARGDSEDLADALEVHQLCLLLGFEGRYVRGDKRQLRDLTEKVSDRILRIRGGWGTSPPWAPPAERIPETKDKWLPRLAYLAAGAAGLALLLFLLFKWSLHSGVGDLEMELIRLTGSLAP